MTPNAGSQYIRNEKPNSPTILLAATLAFKILNQIQGWSDTKKASGDL